MESDIIKKTLKELLILFVIILLFLKIIFFKTDTLILINGTLLFYLTYLIPGLLLTYIFFDKLYPVERYAIAVLLGLIIMGILAYYTGIFLNLHIQIFHYIVPLAVICIEIGILFFMHKRLKT